MQKKYRENNKEKITIYRRKYFKERKENDIGFKLLCNIRARQNRVLTGNSSTTKNLGCNSDELKIWIESNFKEGMNWDNRWKPGRSPKNNWSLDHIIPMNEFLKTGDLKILHYTNIIPIWHINNILKSNKI